MAQRVGPPDGTGLELGVGMTGERIVFVGREPAALGAVAEDLSRDGHAVMVLDPGRARRARFAVEVGLVVIDGVADPEERVEVFRHLARDCRIPVALVDHGASGAERLLWIELGAARVLPRARTPRQFADQVREVLRGRRWEPPGAGPADVPLRAGPLTLFPVRRIVEGPAGRHGLARQESALLEFLMRHPGRTFHRDELLAGVWGPDAGTRSTVTVHVHRVREKIEVDPSHPRQLLTVWGAGYCLDV